ncbi:MAG: DUF2202 domain-containing protein [Bacteroidales bacterium]|nr:DUF2202 domain-containing protein [Bacteroidales bacterium]
MKNAQQKISFSLVFLFGFFLFLTSCSSENENVLTEDSSMTVYKVVKVFSESQPTADIYEPPLSDTAGILYMREEEKLARDVYDYLFEKWNAIIFDNISNSEQIHMDRVLDLINLYGLEDPALPEAGVYANEDLQNLYNSLIAIGDSSLINALIVGAIIEEVDIIDLQDYSNATEDENIQCIYGNLMKGSRNHLRAFYHKLEWMGVDYTPQFLSEDEFYSIVKSPHEIGGTPCGF